MDQNQTNVLASLSVRMLMGTGIFNDVITKYVPDVLEKLTPSLTLKDLMAETANAQAFIGELMEAGKRYTEETAREVREFGVDIDPRGPRYRWGTPEEKEAAVKLIEEQYPVNHGDIICYGPSNMTFWYSLEKDMLPYHAQNHGMGGCTDIDLIEYAPRVLYPYQPSAVIIQTGSNDIASGIPLEEILKRKKEMYDLFLSQLPETKLIVCSGLPLPGRMQYWNATEKTNQLLKELCETDERLYFLDATDAMMTDEGEERYRSDSGRYFNPDLYRMDKIHLNKKGHDVWTKLMKDALRSLGVSAAEEGKA